MVAAIDSCPEDPRCVRIGKESDAFKAHFKRRGLDRRQRYFYLRHHGIINVANKLQGHVQAFHAGPTSFGRQRTRSLHVFRKARAYFCREYPVQ